MLDHGAEAFAAAVQVIAMHADGALDQLDALRPQIRKAAERATRWKRLRGTQMERLLQWMVEKGRGDRDASAAALALAKARVNVAEQDNERFLEPVVPLLLAGFPENVWPLVGQAIVSGRRRARRLEHVLVPTQNKRFGRQGL